MSQILNVPNILTLSRIALLPGFIGGFYMHSDSGLVLSFVVFIICCLTDYLDGHLARTYKQTTEFGKLLDPLADKVLVLVAMLYMIGFDMVSQRTLIPIAVTVCREVIVSSLRGSAFSSNSTFSTLTLAKCKTATQMFALAIIFVAYMMNVRFMCAIGEVLIWLSAVLALISGCQYFRRSVF